ncbi:arginyl-tRNA--protein transferase 1 [Cephus cinctus]|uniref:Arginyl-tRNA--protein transferase 1 n=1 Tax=Cephus cinctus TaxID=211228 RepID=A0AAJ7BJP8_CEPCN|nr:arginyl-tRNA--protein transferase 1 [Cephus cinctus]
MPRECYSIVEYFAEREKHKCGYCKAVNTNLNYGMWAHYLTVQNYQDLIDRGWRRSGSYLYKPVMDQICCPMYTIRCDAPNFNISKSQKKILKRMAKFLHNELKNESMDTSDIVKLDGRLDTSGIEISNYIKPANQVQKNIEKFSITTAESELERRLSPQPMCSKLKKSTEVTSSEGSLTISNITPESGKHPVKKAKQLRFERKLKKLAAQGKSVKEIEDITKQTLQARVNIKSLEELFDEVHVGSNRLEMKLVRVMSEEFLNTLDVTVNLYKEYQMAIHGDPPEKCDKKTFFNFLVKSPLQHWNPKDGPPKGYGSFHEQYWLDNRLIAVGVIDILPLCISSVYFFYDPKLHSLSLGTFSSLREVYLTRQLNKISSNLKFYYMGFYIHTCPKMRYKAKIRPSKLLCPETYVWCDIEKCLPKLDKQKYCRLNEDIDGIDETGIVNIQKVSVLYRETIMLYPSYSQRSKVKDEDEVREYAALVGMKCAQSLLLYRS